MSVARRFAVALAVVGAGVLAYAVPASAHGDDHGGGCVDGTVARNLEHHVDPDAGTATVEGKGTLCAPVDLVLSIYKVPVTWNGNGFPAGGTAVPQTLIVSDEGTLDKDGKLDLAVEVPDCGNVQIDLYYPPEITAVTAAGHGHQFIEGYIWSIGGPNGHPKECAPPSPTPTPTPTPSETSESPTPTPSETSESPTPTPSETSESPTPTPSETSESPTPTPSETSEVPTPTAAPTSGLGGPIPVLPPTPPAAAPPALAETGSDSTVPLLGLGGALLIAGIGLSLLGRKRDTA